MVSKEVWKLCEGGIEWCVDGHAHHDNYEMSGLYCDAIIDYGVDPSGNLLLGCSCYFPTLRTIPNDTHATLAVKVDQEALLTVCRDDQPLVERPVSFRLDGTLTVVSKAGAALTVTRQFFPGSDSKCCIQQLTIHADAPVTLTVPQPSCKVLGHTLGTKGVYVSRVMHNAPERLTLAAGETYTCTLSVSAAPANETVLLPDGEKEKICRYRRIKELTRDSLVLDTGNGVLDTFARFACLRAGESIFETLGGKFHSPGGRTYYAAIWCNDQVEYAGPHFAMTGDPTAVEAALNAYRALVPFMAEDYRPIPSSVIAEGLDIWHGAGDRGDGAMYLYGASAFCLYLGDEKIARELYGPIQWCAEYCRRNLTPEGVIRSDTDELEGRIPTDGYANLSTSCLCYGGLQLASKLADSLDDPDTAREYRRRAEELSRAIENYYGAILHGYETYRYSRGYDTLRAWICLPLCVGLHRRKAGTLAAMLSEHLWTEEGMLSCELSEENRDSTIWDRSTLYGFKAAFAAGEGDLVMERLLTYCRKRLLCDRVPYPVEAYPEGEKRQLSGESALFVRVITEGILGIRPERLKAFSFVPVLPKKLDHIDLSRLYIAGRRWRIRVEAERWFVWRDDVLCKEGETDGNRVILEG